MKEQPRVWLVEFPTYRYEEDVKRTARINNLELVDKRFENLVDPERLAENPPKLTLRPEYKPKRKKSAIKSEPNDSDQEV